MVDPVIVPNWPAPSNVKSLITTRQGGASAVPFDSMNLALHVGDDVECVMANRAHLAEIAGVPEGKVCWLNQVHGTRVVTASHLSKESEADACDSVTSGMVCAVMTADCLPVLLCNQAGTRVAAVHAGWRGLADGVIEAAVKRFSTGDSIIAFLGPAIGPEHFEVGHEVYEQFVARSACMANAFEPIERAQKYMADIYQLARIALAELGVNQVFGGDFCTYSDAARFYSYRRDGAKTGRMASIIWLD